MTSIMVESVAAERPIAPKWRRWLVAALIAMLSTTLAVTIFHILITAFWAGEWVLPVLNVPNLRIYSKAIFFSVLVFGGPPALVGMVTGRMLFWTWPSVSVWPYLIGGGVLGLGMVAIYSFEIVVSPGLLALTSIFLAFGAFQGFISGFVFWWYLWRPLRRAKALDRVKLAMSD